MKSKAPTRSPHRVVFVTVPNLRVGRAIARTVLAARAAACVSIIPGLESHYWWQGRLEQGRELLLILKTTVNRLAELERLVHRQHPYDTPEFVVVEITAGSPRYLAWIDASTIEPPSPRATAKRTAPGKPGRVGR